MKKILSVILFQLIILNLFASEIICFSDISELNKYQYEYFSGEFIYCGGSENLVYIWKNNKGIVIPKENILVDKDGFCYFVYDNEVQTVLNGSNFFYAITPGTWTTVNMSERRGELKYIDNLIYQDSREDDYIKEYDIKKIITSSAYSENLKNGIINYSSKYLNIFECRTVLNVTILQHNPWVPDKKNCLSGIGEYLEIEFTKPKDNLVVLNGFVDFYKRYLYKANNRVKKATITSLDKENPFEIEYEFEDYVHFSEINFPCAVNKVRFTIDEVYKGEKWDDTCIQAVITRWE